MRAYNNEIEISRNESFSIDKIIKNKDGSPYIISNKLRNPYFLVSVSTTTYEQKNRKVYNKWLNLMDMPRFTNTVPVNLKSLMTQANGDIPRYDSFEDITAVQEIDGFPDILAYGYVGNYLFYYTPEDAVFYIEDESGNRVYKYWDGEWKEYSCRIVTAYDTYITREWVGQNYVYSIDLVSGTSTREYLLDIAEDYDISIHGMTNEEAYNILLNKGVKFTANFKLDREIIVFDTYKPILKPKKLTVSSNILGGL